VGPPPPAGAAVPHRFRRRRRRRSKKCKEPAPSAEKNNRSMYCLSPSHAKSCLRAREECAKCADTLLGFFLRLRRHYFTFAHTLLSQHTNI
jgi:hypothetical protein